MRRYQPGFYFSVTLLLASMLLTQVQAQASTDDDATYQKEVEAWRQENEKKLKSPFGWLALTGHYWLKEGENLAAPSREADISLPIDLSVPGKTLFRVTAGLVTLECDRQSSITVNGKASSRSLLAIDPQQPETDGSDSIMIGERVSLQLVRRAGKLAIRVRDSKSELLQRFGGKRWFSVNTDYRVPAKFTPYSPPKIIENPNIKGDRVPMKIVGQLRFTLQGQEFSLDAFEENAQELFVVFRDDTSGRSTYGAGRFLNASLPASSSESVLLDFNRAYNPPCAFSPHTLCPLAPSQNTLAIAIVAGERLSDAETPNK